MLTNTKIPLALVSLVVFAPVSGLVSVTWAPGMTAPVASCTVPLIDPYEVWLIKADGEKYAKANRTSTHLVIRFTNNPLLWWRRHFDAAIPRNRCSLATPVEPPMAQLVELLSRNGAGLTWKPTSNY